MFEAKVYDSPQSSVFRELVEVYGFSLRTSSRGVFGELSEVVAFSELVLSTTYHNSETFRYWKLETSAEHWNGKLSTLMEFVGQVSTDTDADFTTVAGFFTFLVNGQPKIDLQKIQEVACLAKAAYLAEGNRLS